MIIYELLFKKQQQHNDISAQRGLISAGPSMWSDQKHYPALTGQLRNHYILSLGMLGNIRIYHECEGRIDNPSRGSPFSITRLAE